jgi:hypothetical protein
LFPPACTTGELVDEAPGTVSVLPLAMTCKPAPDGNAENVRLLV